MPSVHGVSNDDISKLMQMLRAPGNSPAAGRAAPPAKGTRMDAARQLHKTTRSTWVPVAGRGAEENVSWRGREDAEQEAMLEAALRGVQSGDWVAPGVPRQLEMPELMQQQDGTGADDDSETGWATWGLHKRMCLVCGASPPEVRTMRCAGCSAHGADMGGRVHQHV